MIENVDFHSNSIETLYNKLSELRITEKRCTALWTNWVSPLSNGGQHPLFKHLARGAITDHSCSLLYQRYNHMLKMNHAIRPNRCPSIMVPRRSIFPKRCNQLHAHMLTHNTLQWHLCTYVAPYHSVTRNVTVWCHHYLHNVAASAMYVAASVICLSQQCDMSVAASVTYVAASVICLSHYIWVKTYVMFFEP